MELFGDYREKVLTLYGKKSCEIPEYINILRSWMEKQPHIPSEFLEDRVLEIYLIKNKFSVEKTKQKIECYCSLKSMKIYEPYFDTFQPLGIPSKQSANWVPIPKLSEKYYRVIIGKYWGAKDYDHNRDARNSLLMGEIFLRYDYNDGEVLIIDLSTMPIHEIVARFRANVIAHWVTFLLKGHVARVKQVHLITNGPSVFLSLMKPFIPTKIASRIIQHENFESLKNHFSPDDLPKDYGGNLKSLREMLVDMDKFYETHEQDIKKYASVKSREELRVGGPATDEMQGTFRKLDID